MTSNQILLEMIAAERLAEIRQAAEQQHIGGGTPLYDRLAALLHTLREYVTTRRGERALRRQDANRVVGNELAGHG